MKYVYRHKTVLGYIFIEEEASAITGVYLEKELSGTNKKTPLIEKTIQQLDEYLSGSRKTFTIEINLQGTNFQKKIWQELVKIPYGTAISYKELAQRVGNPKGFRAAGGACNKNPILLIIPCHRVIGADGKLVGFGAGLSVKERLLSLERNGHFK